MASIKGFIFDLDGVLVDTAKYHYKAWQKLAKTLGLDFSEKENEQLKGVSRVESLNKILDWGGVAITEARKEELMGRKNEWYLELVNDMNQDEVLQDVKPFLRQAKEAGLKIAMGSASRNAMMILEKTELDKYFEAIIDGNKTLHSKPHPEVFLLGAEALKLDPSEIIVFEDAPAGIQAARKGGFKCVGIGNPEILKDADLVISGLHEMSPMEIINKLNFKK